jgi:uncharacterized protein (DUF885 family)
VTRALKWLGLTVAVLLAGAIALFVHVWYFKPVSIDWFYDRLFTSFVLGQPEFLSQMRIVPSWLEWYGSELDDESPAHAQRRADLMRAGLDTLHRYDRAALDPEGRLSYDTLEYYLRSKVDGDRYREHDFPVNQLFGVQSELPSFLMQVHQVTSAREADSYVARLEKVPRKFAELLESLRLRESKNVIPPRFTVEKVIVQMKGFVGTPPRSNPLYVTFKEKLDRIPADRLDAAQRDRLLARVETAITQQVYPAYGRLIDYFTALLPKAEGSFGAWHLPEGGEYYAWCVRAHTTTDLTPAQVHDLGVSEVERISGEIDAILRAQGLSQGSVGARLRQLSRDPAQHFPNTPEGRDALLGRYREILAEASSRLGEAFRARPQYELEVRPIPQFAQATAPPAYYTAPAFDGSRPGVFYANTRDVGATPKFEMRTMAYHEGTPGHHLQISLAQALPDVPFFRRVVPFTAYAEGWALYAECLAYEMGLERDPLDNVGRLRHELFRATRLVVDTGIHYKRWTREQAIAYMIERTGMAEADLTAEVERYFVNPGQALAYKVGMMRILALRDKARQALGPKFDLRDFHDQVLLHGALPLVVLDRVIDDWIATGPARRDRAVASASSARYIECAPHAHGARTASKESNAMGNRDKQRKEPKKPKQPKKPGA